MCGLGFPRQTRLICIHVAIDGVTFNICNLYAPNREESDCFHMVNRVMSELWEAQTMIAGDFNQVQDALLDCTYHNIP